MCGIAGIVNAEPDCAVSPRTIRRMCDTIIHRGPDDEGIYAFGPVGLGIRRLSIIDLVSGQQPIHNEDCTVWVVLNGEIYNFPDLRRELETTGHRFYTQTDTEVIVHLYEDLGSDCVKKLRGMFALALYDRRCRKLLMARDRLGKKPLYYAVSNGRLIFGSEIKAIFAAAPELQEPNPESLFRYFCFGYIPDPYSAYKQIKKLPPGHLLEFVGGEIKTEQYWELPSYGTYEPKSEEECLEELEPLLAEAVRMRLISDVPLGVLLSGGVDSSIVTALMARASSRVRTFSIGFDNRDFNEAKYARIVAQRFGTEHSELILNPNIGETLETLTCMLEEPFADSSMLPTYYVCCLARRDVTVALAGDGGDELFAGYDRYVITLGREVFNFVPPRLGRWYRTRIYPSLPDSLRGRKFMYNVSLPLSDRYIDGICFLNAYNRHQTLFSPAFLEATREMVPPPEEFQQRFNDAPAVDALSKMQFLDTKTYLPGDILTKVDRMSMATSLEVRAPLLDHLVAEWSARLSPQWKIRSGQAKYILKRLAERVGVPKEVLYRPKRGFAMPLVHWFRNELKNDFLSILLEPKTIQRGYFNSVAIRRLLKEHQSGRDRSGELWVLLMFELWHRNFLEKNTERALQARSSVCPSHPTRGYAERRPLRNVEGSLRAQ